MSKPTIKDLREQLVNEQRLRIQAEDANISLQSKLECSPKVKEQLNMANGTVAELMKEVERLKKELTDIDTLKELYANADMYAKNYAIENTQLKSDYALLEENYYTQMDNYTEVNKELTEMIDKYNKVSAENHALKQEIERTNRHINLAENQLNKEQQPLVVNNYHNCVINK